jgi:thiamine biosynthesis protein ThiS
MAESRAGGAVYKKRPCRIEVATNPGVWVIAAGMEIVVNGEKRDIAPMSLAALLATLGLGEAPMAVELNGQVIKKQNHAATSLHEGDTLEIVTFVGGG